MMGLLSPAGSDAAVFAGIDAGEVGDCGRPQSERASRVTCCAARAVNLATEICGLFLSASCSASFMRKGHGNAVACRCSG